jgi:hypothetical protein
LLAATENPTVIAKSSAAELYCFWRAISRGVLAFWVAEF